MAVTFQRVLNDDELHKRGRAAFGSGRKVYTRVGGDRDIPPACNNRPLERKDSESHDRNDDPRRTPRPVLARHGRAVHAVTTTATASSPLLTLGGGRPRTKRPLRDGVLGSNQ